MRSRTAEWFETKITYDKAMDDGQQKHVKELYVVDALSFTEAEKRITEQMTHCISGAFMVTDIKKATYKEVFFADSESADRWYKAKLQFITLDEKSGEEKRSNVYYLVQAATFQEAVANIDKIMSTTMVDYVIASLAETVVMDVFEN